MKLAVFSHKPCWRSDASPSGYATDGGFPFQMRALAGLFEETAILVPVHAKGDPAGELPLSGDSLRVVALPVPGGHGWLRKVGLLVWSLRCAPRIVRELRKADAVHAAIPGDIGTIGMLAAWVLRKPLLVRHCGNWLAPPRTAAEHFWRWFMQRTAGGRNIMLATGGGPQPSHNPNLHWIFSTSLTDHELASLRKQPRALTNRRLIIACRQEPGKGTGVTIEALAMLAREMPDLTLDVVGAGSALESYQQRAKALGVKDRVCFHGRVGHEEVLALLDKAALFCYPTASEGFPKAVLEALACGLPVISTRVSVIPELLAAGGGVALEAMDAGLLASAIRNCLSDPARYRAMSASAFETARQFSLERWQESISGHIRRTWGMNDAGN